MFVVFCTYCISFLNNVFECLYLLQSLEGTLFQVVFFTNFFLTKVIMYISNSFQFSTISSFSSTPLENFNTQPANVCVLLLQNFSMGMVVFTIHLSSIGS